jgi:hypothetical protein
MITKIFLSSSGVLKVGEFPEGNKPTCVINAQARVDSKRGSPGLFLKHLGE